MPVQPDNVPPPPPPPQVLPAPLPPETGPIYAGSNDARLPAIIGIGAETSTPGQYGRANGLVLGASPTDFGVFGQSGVGPGVFGTSDSGAGVSGYGGGGPGVTGTSESAEGVYGESRSGRGVSGLSGAGEGVFGSGKNGVHGQSSSASDSGVWGENTGKGYGVSGSTNSDFVAGSGVTAGVWGNNVGSGTGVKGTSQSGDGIVGFSNSSVHAGISANNTGGGYGLWAEGKTAGYFQGPVEVNGNFTCDGNHHCKGVMTVDGADFAEDFSVVECAEVEPGAVMVLDETGILRPCEESYDRKVVGVISGAGDYKPGLIFDRHKPSVGRLPLALVGKVYCKVDAAFGAIEVGDLLTTSPTPGHAMRAADPVEAFGAVIGKALRRFGEGRGLIPILIALQ